MRLNIHDMKQAVQLVLDWHSYIQGSVGRDAENALFFGYEPLMQYLMIKTVRIL